MIHADINDKLRRDILVLYYLNFRLIPLKPISEQSNKIPYMS
jgi:hypothetical protein